MGGQNVRVLDRQWGVQRVRMCECWTGRGAQTAQGGTGASLQGVDRPLSCIHCSNTATQQPFLRQLASGSSSAHRWAGGSPWHTRSPVAIDWEAVAHVPGPGAHAEVLRHAVSLRVLNQRAADGRREAAGAAVERRCLPCGGRHAQPGQPWLVTHTTPAPSACPHLS